MAAAAITFGIFFWLFMTAVGVLAYFLPTIIAAMARRSNVAMVALVNLLLGWSFVGWIVALVMALTSESRPVIVQVVQQPQPPMRYAQRPARPVPGHDLMERRPPRPT